VSPSWPARVARRVALRRPGREERKKERKTYARCQACVKGALASKSHRGPAVNDSRLAVRGARAPAAASRPGGGCQPAPEEAGATRQSKAKLGRGAQLAARCRGCANGRVDTTRGEGLALCGREALPRSAFVGVTAVTPKCSECQPARLAFPY
jgi:hypothetical protein